MKRTPILTIIALFLFALSSCKNKGSGLFVPAEAVIVMHVNTSSLTSKVSWDEVKNSSWFKEMHEQTKDTVQQKMLENPESAGVDVKSDLFFFITQRGSGAYSIFEGKLKDAAAFEALNKKMTNKSEVESSDGYKMMTLSSSSMLAWNDKQFAYINNIPGMGNLSSFGNRRMSSENGYDRGFGTDSLRVFVKSVLNSEGKSVYDDKRFTSLLQENGDMHLWFNSSSMMKMGMAEMMSMMKVSDLLEANAAGMTLNFDDGKIMVKMKGYVNQNLAKLLEKFPSKNISADLLGRIPSTDVLAVYALTINPETLKEVIKAGGFEGPLNSFLSNHSLTANEVFSAMSGQFLIAASDLHMKDTTMSFGGEDGNPSRSIAIKNPEFNILFAAGVNNQANFQKLFDIGKEQVSAPAFPYKLTKDWFAAGKNQSSVDGFLSGNIIKQPWADKITGHPFGAYVDLQKIFHTNFSEDSAAKAMMTEAAAVWQDVTMTGGEMKDGVSEAELVVNMMDKKTNSLKQLNGFIDRMYKQAKSRQHRYEYDAPGEEDSMKIKVAPVMPPPAGPNN